MVYWGPPDGSVQEELSHVNDMALHKYGPIAGLPRFQEQLLAKCRDENGITGKEIMITAGANQGKQF